MTGADRFNLALRAASLMAVDPAGCGGLVVHASPGPVREWYLDLLKQHFAGPWRRLPIHTGEDRLLGGLDLVATLRARRPVIEKGVLAGCHQGALVVPMAERLSSWTLAVLTATLDKREVVIERDGLTFTDPANFAVIALDESQQEDEAIAPKLLDRLAFLIDLEGVGWREAGAFSGLADAEAIAAAKISLRAVHMPPPLLEAICLTAAKLGIQSLRPPLLAVQVARHAAALEGRLEVGEEDATLAAQLVLAPRAAAFPEAPEPETPPPEPEQQPPDEQPRETLEPPLEDMILEAAMAVIPDDLLARLRAGAGLRSQAHHSGRAGQLIASKRSGRPAGVRHGLPRGGHRLSLIDSLRAAAPWQTLRRAEGRMGRHDRLLIHAEDLRIRRFQERTESTVIFLVDASGSTALNRLAEAKGAIELLLADCYVRREQVALITFRGKSAEILLPPTRSLTRAKRQLAGLPGGGGTPLAAGLEAATELAVTIRRKGQTPFLVVLTDGRPNVRRDGLGGRADAASDAMTAARLLQANAIASLVIDTGQRPEPFTRELAARLDGPYVPLPRANADQLSKAVRRSRADASMS
ncbi:MAG: magnesium chelatase subunit D [Pseudomonadota bacterium]